MATERLQKVLANAGVASRRHAEELIRAGQVEVNGRVVTEMGVSVDPSRDRIRVQGKPLPRVQPVYLLLNKPPNMITTLQDPEGRPTVAEILPREMPRAYPVGRLDWDTQGALLLTNDGELAHRLLHPRHGMTKVYRAKVEGHPGPEALSRLEQGVTLDEGEQTGPAVVELMRANPNNSWVRLIISEGRHHQVKRMLEAVGHPVIKLRRDAFAGISVEGLKVGEYRALTRGEVNDLRSRVGLPTLPPRGPRADIWEPKRGGAAAAAGRGKRWRRPPPLAPGAAEERRDPFGPWHPRRREELRQHREQLAEQRRGKREQDRPAAEEPPRRRRRRLVGSGSSQGGRGRG